jgi:hypothetical protein
LFGSRGQLSGGGVYPERPEIVPFSPTRKILAQKDKLAGRGEKT